FNSVPSPQTTYFLEPLPQRSFPMADPTVFGRVYSGSFFSPLVVPSTQSTISGPFTAPNQARTAGSTTLVPAAFMLLHIQVKNGMNQLTPLGPGQTLTVDLNDGLGDPDIFTSVDGSDFWTRPIKHNSTNITLS